MSKFIFINGKPLITGTGKFVILDKDIQVVSGGTATGVVVTNYGPTEEATLKQELVDAGTFTTAELSGASILNINGTSTGTVVLDVSKLGKVGDSIKILHKKTAGWETLYEGTIPASMQVTVTLTEFSPIIGAKANKNVPKLKFNSAGGYIKVSVPQRSNITTSGSGTTATYTYTIKTYGTGGSSGSVLSTATMQISTKLNSSSVSTLSNNAYSTYVGSADGMMKYTVSDNIITVKNKSVTSASGIFTFDSKLQSTVMVQLPTAGFTIQEGEITTVTVTMMDMSYSKSVVSKSTIPAGDFEIEIV